MAFCDSVTALLDTYSNCVALLKAFRRGRRETVEEQAQHQYTRLRKSLRSDRSLVERAYSSKLSESGSRFKRGDARAISALDRVLGRLKNAITRLLRLSTKRNGLELDYKSLMSLSNASRTEAIRAIDSLSRRLGSPSRSSVVSSSPSKTSTRAAPPSRQQQRSPSKAGTERRPSDSPSKKSSSTIRQSKSPGRPQKSDVRRPRKSPTPPPSPKPAQAQPPQARSSRPPSGSSSHKPKLVVHNRISMLSFSSASTKLGEVPPRKWRSAYYAAADPDGDDYNVRPVFPLNSYTTEVRERRFWGFFSRKREG